MKNFFLAIFLILFCSIAVAQSCDTSSLDNCNIDSLTLSQTSALALSAANQIKQILGVMELQIQTMKTSSPLIGLGKYTLSILIVLVIIWNILKNMLLQAGVNQLLYDLVFPFLIFGIAYSSLDQNLGQIVSDSIESISTILTHSNDSKGTSSQIFAENMLKSMLVIWDSPNSLNPLNFGIDMAISFLLKLISIFIIAASTAVGVSYLLIAKFQVSLAIALAPIMIPWAIWKPTEFITSSWLNFLLKGSFVSLTVMSIEFTLRSSVSNLATLSGSVPVGVNAAFVYGVVTLLAILYALLISKSYELGSSLISGNLSLFRFQSLPSSNIR